MIYQTGMSVTGGNLFYKSDLGQNPTYQDAPIAAIGCDLLRVGESLFNIVGKLVKTLYSEWGSYARVMQ